MAQQRWLLWRRAKTAWQSIRNCIYILMLGAAYHYDLQPQYNILLSLAVRSHNCGLLDHIQAALSFCTHGWLGSRLEAQPVIQTYA